MAVYDVSQFATKKYGPEAVAIPEVSYRVDPVVAEPLNYTIMSLTWHSPVGDWTGLRVLKSYYGYAVHETDGEILLDTSSPSQSLLDDNVRPGAWHYYSIFVQISGVWQYAGGAGALMIQDHGYGKRLFNSLPQYHQSLGNDGQDSPIENASLQKFLNVLGWGLDYSKTNLDSLQHLNDPSRNNTSDLARLSDELGITYEASAPSRLFRKRVSNAAVLGRERGTLDQLQSLITLTTSYGVALSMSPNSMVTDDAASFTHPIFPPYSTDTKYLSTERVSFNNFAYQCKAGGAYGGAQAPSGAATTNTWWTYLSSTVDPALVDADGAVYGWEPTTPSPLPSVIIAGTWVGPTLGSVTGGNSFDLTVSATHGLVVGDPVQLSGLAEMSPIVAGTTYYVLLVPSPTVLHLTASPGGAIIYPPGLGATASSITRVASILTLSKPAGFSVGNQVMMGPVTGAAPFSGGVSYYVTTMPTTTTITLSPSSGGAAIWTTATGTATSIHQYPLSTTPAFGLALGVQNFQDSTDLTVNALNITNITGATADLGADSIAKRLGESTIDPEQVFRFGIPIPVPFTWNSIDTYPRGTLVNYGGQVYRSLSEVTGDAPGDVLIFGDYFDDVFDDIFGGYADVNWELVGSEDRVTLALSLYAKAGTGFEVPAYPVIKYFDELGATIAILDTENESTSGSSFDSFGSRDGALAGRVLEMGDATWVQQSGSWSVTDDDGGIVWPLATGLILIPGNADGNVAVTFDTGAVGSNSQFVAFRAASPTSFLMATRMALYSSSAGVNTLIGTYSTPFSDQDRITINFIGNAITIKRHGVLVLSATSAFNQTSPDHGLGVGVV